MRILGFMTGTSLDAVDMAVLETDGETIQAFGPAGERKLTEATREAALAATMDARGWKRGEPAPASFEVAHQAVAQEHLEAAEDFLREHGLRAADFDYVGMHGQTVLHERPSGGVVGRTVQLGDAALLARGLGVPVVYDFRTADVAVGGEGAPLAPVYHRARAQASGLEAPLAVLNIGGVANITLIGRDGALTAFDTGPGNGMLDLLLQQRGAGRYDAEGALARAGRVNQAVLGELLAHAYFTVPAPKSLDRYDFPLDRLDGLSIEDAAATLTAFTTAAIGLALDQAADRPQRMIVAGGGRHNPAIMAALADAVDVPVLSAEAVGWRGDAIEAEAFAYLAARTVAGLPISFPGTTGVAEPMRGGRIVHP